MTKEIQVALSHKRKIIILTGLIVGSMAPTFYSYARGNALPSILAEFNGMEFYAILSIVAVLTMAIGTPIAGKLGDMFGRKHLFIGGSVAFLISLIGCAMASGTWSYAVWIGLSGAAFGFTTSAVNAVIGDVCTEEERPKYIGYNSTVSSLVLLAAPPLTGLLIDLAGWRSVFLVGIPFPIISSILLIRALPNIKPKTERRERVDVLGALSFLLALSPLLILLSLGGTMIPWTSSTALILVAVAVVFCVVLAYVDTHHPAPMIAFYMFRDRDFSKLFFASFLFSFGTSAATYLPYYFQNVVGVSVSLSGTLVTPRSVATLITTALVGAVMSKTGKYKQPLLLMLLLSTVSYAAMALFFTPDTSTAMILVITIINGIGGTAMNVAIITMAVRSLPYKDMGTGVALLTLSSSLAALLCNAIGGLLTNSAWGRTVIPGEIQSVLTTEQLGQLQSSSILKDSAALETIRSGLSADIGTAFDEMIQTFRETVGQGVAGLFWVMAITSLLALVLVLRYREPEATSMKQE